MATYDVIIPHLGLNSDLTAKAMRCLHTIEKYSQDYRVIWIDNGSPEGEFDAILPVLALVPHMLIRNSSNQGFVKATNQGLRFSTAPYIVMLNNDCEAAPGWLEQLRQPFDEDPSIGLCGPLTTDGGWQARYRERNMHATGWMALDPGNMLAFFCCMMSRRCLEQVGYQSEEFAEFGGFGGDDLYCWQAEQKGFRLALQRDLTIAHHRRSTFHTLHSQQESKAMQELALARFREKQRS